MTDTHVTAPTETDALAKIINEANEYEVVIDGEHRARFVRFSNGEVTDLDPLNERPHHYKGTTTFETIGSLLDWVDMIDPADVSFYCSKRDAKIVAVLDDHRQDTPGWRRFTANHRVTRSEEWETICQMDGEFFTAAHFAELIEDNQHLISDPDTADLVDLVRNFRATQKVTFGDEINDSSGDRALTWKTETSTGELVIPATLTFVVSIYDGVDERLINARFRYRLNEGRALFGVKLIQAAVAEDQAFDSLLDLIKVRHTDRVFRGSI